MDHDGNGWKERMKYPFRACHPWDAIAVANDCCNRAGIQFNDCQRRRRRRSVQEEKEKKKADEITILLWLEIIASKKIAFSRGREEMGGRKTLRAVVYFIKYSETQSFCTFVSVLLYLYFSIYVFSTLRAPTKVLCSLLWEREKERGRNREEEKGTVTTPPIRFPSATTGKRMEIGSNLLMIRDRVLEAQSPFPFRPFR